MSPKSRASLVGLALLAAAVAGGVPPARAQAPSGGDTGEKPGEKEFNRCIRMPANRKFKLNLKPEVEMLDLIHWISSVTCTQFLVPNTVPLQGRKVTVVAPEPVTPTDAYRLFYAALEAVNLTVE